MQRAVRSLLSRAGRAPVFRQPQARNMSGIPGKEQMNAAAARAGDELGNVGASIGENIQKLQWWTMPKVLASPPASACVRQGVCHGCCFAAIRAHAGLQVPGYRSTDVLTWSSGECRLASSLGRGRASALVGLDAERWLRILHRRHITAVRRTIWRALCRRFRSSRTRAQMRRIGSP
jgi:hypothetical protein